MAPEIIAIGQRVTTLGKTGVVRFVGTTEFSPGQWIGIELDQPTGKNDGSVKGVRYFECSKTGNAQGLYGLFVRPNTVKPITSSRRSSITPSSPSKRLVCITCIFHIQLH